MATKRPYFKRWFALTVENVDYLNLLDFDCSFHVQLFNGVAVNRAVFSVDNPPGRKNKDDKELSFREKLIDSAGKRFILQAGYEDGNQGEIFRGKVLFVNTEKMPNKFRITLNATSDLGIDSFVNVSFSKGITVAQIVEHVAKQTKLQVGFISPKLNYSIYQKNFIVSKTANELLNQVAKDYSADGRGRNFGWYVEDDKINFVEDADYVHPYEIFAKEEYGMLGYPEVNIDAYNLQYSAQMSMFLNPNIRPQMKMTVDQAMWNVALTGLPVADGLKIDAPPPFISRQVTHSGIISREERGASNLWRTDIIGGPNP